MVFCDVYVFCLSVLKHGERKNAWHLDVVLCAVEACNHSNLIHQGMAASSYFT